MRKAVTLRFDAALLEDAWRCAMPENRTLINFIETVLKARVVAQRDADPEVVARLSPIPRTF